MSTMREEKHSTFLLSVVRNVERALRRQKKLVLNTTSIASLDMTRSESSLCKYTNLRNNAILCQSPPEVACSTVTVFRAGTGYNAFHFVQGAGVGHGGWGMF